MERTLSEETISKVGEKVLLKGWVDARRDHGKIVFIDLRDRTGVVQVVCGSEAKELRPEFVVAITGVIKNRPENLVNQNISTGNIEVSAEKIEVLNRTKDLPISIDTAGHEIDEEVRLKYRYLDLRRSRMQNIIRLRSRFIASLREKLLSQDFVEIETPLLTKSTKEGARDFLVPSRFQPGKFYALPQSPQQYKQLLMTAGFERYFQVAKCIRDEDLRADRGFEFTQLDLEMSFVSMNDVMSTVENAIKSAVEEVGGKLKDKQFPVINYQDAMRKYGVDKFDLRDEEEKQQNILSFAWVVNFPFFKKVDSKDAAEVADSKSGWTFTHNPFSTPIPEHLPWHLAGEHVDQIITAQYDLVCNGYEVGGGSIRAHLPEILLATYKIMGYTEAEVEAGVGHMLEAFRLGTPPHGGIALGLDRLVMLLSNESSLKEAIAFPMTSTGRTAVMDAPSEATSEQLRELGISVIGKTASGIGVFEKIKEVLDSAKVRYALYEHEPVFTSEEAAKVRGTTPEQGAKALVMVADGKPVMLVVPGHLQVNIRKFKSRFGLKELQMAKPEEVKELTGVEIGAVPPFGNIFSLPLYVDSELLKCEEIAFNAGRHDRSIIMKYKDFEKLTRPTVESFSSEA